MRTQVSDAVGVHLYPAPALTDDQLVSEGFTFTRASDGAKAKPPTRTKHLDVYLRSLKAHGPCAKPEPEDVPAILDAAAKIIASYPDLFPRRWPSPDDSRDRDVDWLIDLLRPLDLPSMPARCVELLRARLSEAEFSDEYLIERIAAKAASGFTEPSTERLRMAEARRVAAEERKQRNAIERARKAELRQLCTTTPRALGLGALQIHANASPLDPTLMRYFRGVAGEVVGDPCYLRLKDGSRLFLVSLGTWADLEYPRIEGVGSPFATLWGPDERIEGFTKSEIDGASMKPSDTTDVQIDAAIRGKRAATLDTSAIPRATAADESTARGRTLIALFTDKIRPHLRSFHKPRTWGDMSHPGRWAPHLIEYGVRGLMLRDEVVHEVVLHEMHRYAQEEGIKAVDWDEHDATITRLISRYRDGEGCTMSPGECIPLEMDAAAFENSSDPWTAVLSVAVGGKDEIRMDDAKAALRAAGVSSLWSNLTTGRLTKAMGSLGFVRHTAKDDEGRSYQAYVREVAS